MSEKTLKGSGDEDGGGEAGEGGGGSGSCSTGREEFSAAGCDGMGQFSGDDAGDEPIHKLLPNITEVIEKLDWATIDDVQEMLEKLTSVSYPKKEIIVGLENGIHLNLFDVRKEYRVNPRCKKDDSHYDKLGEIEDDVKNRKKGKTKKKSRRFLEEWSNLPKSVETNRRHEHQRQSERVGDRCRDNTVNDESGNCNGDYSKPSLKRKLNQKQDINAKRKKTVAGQSRNTPHPQNQSKSKLLVNMKPLEKISTYNSMFT